MGSRLTVKEGAGFEPLPQAANLSCLLLPPLSPGSPAKPGRVSAPLGSPYSVLPPTDLSSPLGFGTQTKQLPLSLPKRSRPLKRQRGSPEPRVVPPSNTLPKLLDFILS